MNDEEKRCWMCRRTSKEVLTDGCDMYFNIVGDEIICIKEWELTLFDVKQNICVICDKLIQMVIEKKGD
jgi:hypothetical protein